MNEQNKLRCPDCNTPMMRIGTSHLRRSITIKGIGNFRLDIVSMRCEDIEFCNGGVEISDHPRSKYQAILMGHVWTIEGKYIHQIKELSKVEG